MARFTLETVTSFDSSELEEEKREESPLAEGLLMEARKEAHAAAVTHGNAMSEQKREEKEGRTSNPYMQTPKPQRHNNANEVTPQQNEFCNSEESKNEDPARNRRSILDVIKNANEASRKRKGKDPPAGDRTAKVMRDGPISVSMNEEDQYSNNRDGSNQSTVEFPERLTTPTKLVATAPEKREDKEERSKTIELATYFKCEGCSADQSLMASKMFAECRKCKHKTEDKYGDHIWRPCEHAVGTWTVPENTETQREAMKVTKNMMERLHQRICEGNKVELQDFETMWTIRDACIAGNLLLRDCYQKPDKHAGLQDELSNCKRALICEDRVGFRKSFLSFMYYMLVGYQHMAVDNEKSRGKKKGDTNGGSPQKK